MIDAVDKLRELGLVVGDRTSPRLDEIPEQELRSLLLAYLNWSRQSLRQRTGDAGARATDTSLVLGSASDTNSPERLLPYATFYDRLITDDPLAHYAVHYAHPNSKTHLIQADPVATLDRSSLSKSIDYFTRLAPLIESRSLEPLPLSSQSDPPESIPIRYDPDGFVKSVPEHLRAFVHQSARVQAATMDLDSGSVLVFDRPPGSSRNSVIFVGFEGDLPRHGSFYIHGWAHKHEEHDDGTITIRQVFHPDADVPPDEFRSWAHQSVNQAAAGRIRAVAEGLAIAERLGSPLLIESEFEAVVCGIGSDSNRGEMSAVEFLDANLGMLQITDPREIVRFKQANPKQITRLRESLSVFSQIARDEGGDYTEACRRVFRREVLPEIKRTQDLIAQVASSTAKGAIGAGATIALAMATGSSVPFITGLVYATVCGGSEALPSVREYMAARNRPEFVWAKLLSR